MKKWIIIVAAFIMVILGAVSYSRYGTEYPYWYNPIEIVKFELCMHNKALISRDYCNPNFSPFDLGLDPYYWSHPISDQKPENRLDFSWDKQKIIVANKIILTIDQFPDEIQVSKDASFGTSDAIKDVKLSPDGKWLAIAINGAAHDFGWVYEISTAKLKSVIFSYGGGVKIKEWKSNTSVTFIVETPKPDTFEKTVDVNNLPEYPL